MFLIIFSFQILMNVRPVRVSMGEHVKILSIVTDVSV